MHVSRLANLHPKLGCFLAVWLVLQTLTGAVSGQVLRLDIQADSSALPQGVKLTRLDCLLSGLALKRQDGSWLESRDWFAFFSADKAKARARAEATGIPKETFTAIRFSVGVPAAANGTDPASWPPEHALNPGVCGLHWGWQGGYIFMALEGMCSDAQGQPRGFSYHLAREANLTRVELPVTFQGGGPVTLRLSLDAGRLLQKVDFDKDGLSTHSRDGDPLAAKLGANLAAAFRVDSVSYDLFQDLKPAAGTVTKSAPPPAGTHPNPLAVTQRFPQIGLPVDNPLTMEGVKLGEKLFHDTRLSINNTQSCASCHDRTVAFSDARRFSVGALGDIGKRQSMPLFNLAWAQSFFWDGRSTSLRDQVVKPIEDTHEMAESLERVAGKIGPELADEFEAAFGSPGVTGGRIALALEQHLLTLISQDSRFDRAVRKVAELTEEEKRGLQLFVTEHDPKRGLFGADCFHCHGGTLFTDHQFKNNGLELSPEDLGRMVVTGNEADRGKFKTPSLRNIAVTAPYMHDGRFSSLEEVVEHYSTGVQRSANLDPNLAKHPVAGLQLRPADKHALVAFLKTLTDESFVAPPSRPSPALVSKP